MALLCRLTLRIKLALLLVLSAAAVAAAIGAAGSLLYRKMLDDRVDKLHAVVQVALDTARSLAQQEQQQTLSRERAMALFAAALHTIRFDNGDGYIVAYGAGRSPNSRIVLHGANPKLDDTESAARDATGRPLADLMTAALRDGEQGFVGYTFTKPGERRPQPKVAYMARFTPWQLVLSAGAYTDDLNASFYRILLRLAAIGCAILLITWLLAWLIEHDVAGSLHALQGSMARLAAGEASAAVAGTDRRDEVGIMARALLVLRDAVQRAELLANQQQDDRRRADAARQAALLAMAETIESEAGEAMTEVSRRTGSMAENATAMHQSAERTGGAAGNAAGAAAQALLNAQTVASAAEELSIAIREISRQVAESTDVVTRAVGAGRDTRQTIDALNDEVVRIGTVAEMIGEIAARTNLLALNATIEAARAGEAGRGFTVVANEVKQLAAQTTRCTAQITGHIAEVRKATGASVAAVTRIEATIEEMNAIASSVSAAVEEQGSATAEIARSVNETASAAHTMTAQAQEVSQEAERTADHAAAVLDDTTALQASVHGLQRMVIHAVRTACEDVDRRKLRRRPCRFEARLSLAGQPVAAVLHDISEQGCSATAEVDCPAGAEVVVQLPRFAQALRGKVVHRAADRLHIAFIGDRVPTAIVDRLSLESVADLVAVAKADHVAFVQRIAQAVGARTPFPPDQLKRVHECRLGLWCDTISDPETLSLPALKAIGQPHRAVHDLGRQAMAALGKGDAAEADRLVQALTAASLQVRDALDAFGHAFPATLGTVGDGAVAAE